MVPLKADREPRTKAATGAMDPVRFGAETSESPSRLEFPFP